MADDREPRKKKAAPGSPDPQPAPSTPPAPGSPPAPGTAAELRRQAEQRLAGLSAAAAAAAASPFPEDQKTVTHELRVHQIELEMQNEELRRAALQLQASHDKYFERFEQAPVGYLTLTEGGVVEEANLTAAGLLGVERREVIGRPFHDFVLADDQDVYYRQRRQLAELGRTVDFELRLKHAGGRTVWASLQGRPLEADEDEPLRIHLTFADVTERRRSEAALAESERLFRLMFEQAPIGAALVGLDYRFLRVNSRFAKVTGYSEEELLGLGFPDLTHPDDVAADMAAARRLKSGEMSEYAREKRYVRKDGSIAWVDIVVRPVLGPGGAPASHLMMARDITERRRSEAALRESEERLQTVFEAAHEGILLQDRDGRIRAWNAAAEDVMGVAESDIVGETVLGRDWHTVREDGTPWPPEEFPSLKTLADGEPQHDIVMGVARDGELRWININAEPVFNPDEAGPAGAVVTFDDITARRRTDRLLAVPQEILGIIASPTPVRETVERIVAALQRATGLDAVGLRLKVGDDYPFVGSLGYSDEFLAAENVLAERSPDNKLCRNADGSINLECTCGLVISGAADPANPLFTAGGSAWTNDSLPLLDVPPEDDPRRHPRNRCIHAGFRSLALVPLRAGDEILGLLHLGDSHTDRLPLEWIPFFEGLGASIGVALHAKQAEDALRESKVMRDITEAAAHVGSTRHDLTTGHATWSPEMYRLFAIAPEEFTGDTMTIFEKRVHPGDLARLRGEVAAVRATGRAGPVEFRLVWPDGSEHVLHGEAVTECDADGTPTAITGYYQDVTEQRRAEDEIKQLNERLSYRLVDRIAQLDMANQELESYAYAVSHDVRTPLRAIDGFSETVLQDEADKLSPQSVEDLGRVRAAAQEMARLMDDLLGFSKVTHRDLLRRRVDVSALAAEVATELADDDAPRRVQVSIEPDLAADADPTLLRMILRELLGNAWKFTSHHDSAHVEVGALQAGGELEFYVRDDGAGFDEQYAQHLFGLFQRMHPRGEFPGDGVGLATVQRLVRRHGGRVWAEAAVEKGATVYFTLPPEAGPAD